MSTLTLSIQFFCFSFEKIKRGKQPLADLYHFTSDESWRKIRDQKKITAGKNGYIFTTSNANIRKIGSGKSRSKTPPTVIIRDEALDLFSSNYGLSPTGNKFYGSIFSEYNSIQRGNILITKSKEYLNVIIVFDAQFIEEYDKRKFYLNHLSFLTIAHKWASQFIHLFSLIGLITIWNRVALIERNWIFLLVLALTAIAGGLKLGNIFKNRWWGKE